MSYQHYFQCLAIFLHETVMWLWVCVQCLYNIWHFQNILCILIYNCEVTKTVNLVKSVKMVKIVQILELTIFFTICFQASLRVILAICRFQTYQRVEVLQVGQRICFTPTIVCRSNYFWVIMTASMFLVLVFPEFWQKKLICV